MKKHSRCAAVLFLLLLLVGLFRASAAGPRDELLVSAAWVAQHREDPGLVLLHVGDRKEYDAAHIPGARFVSLQDLSVSDQSGKGLTLEMLPAEELRMRLESLGISDASRIIVYHGTGPITRATRIIFTLDYAGLGSRTSLLDGGLAEWIRAGHPVTDIVPAPAKGTLSALTLRPIVVDAARVRASLNKPGVAVVDARATTLYDGTRPAISPGRSACRSSPSRTTRRACVRPRTCRPPSRRLG
jgi:thiosulfate/3-mercaptopyruvate sulfurtransferase